MSEKYSLEKAQDEAKVIQDQVKHEKKFNRHYDYDNAAKQIETENANLIEKLKEVFEEKTNEAIKVVEELSADEKNSFAKKVMNPKKYLSPSLYDDEVEDTSRHFLVQMTDKLIKEKHKSEMEKEFSGDAYDIDRIGNITCLKGNKIRKIYEEQGMETLKKYTPQQWLDLFNNNKGVIGGFFDTLEKDGHLEDLGLKVKHFAVGVVTGNERLMSNPNENLGKGFFKDSRYELVESK